MRLRSLPLLLAFTLSCKSPAEPDNAIVLQSFDLSTVENQALPEMVDADPGTELWMDAETIEIRDDGRVKLIQKTTTLIVPPGAAMPQETNSTRLPFVMEGDSIKVYRSSSCMTTGCDLEARGTIIGAEMLLLRPDWSSFKIFRYVPTPAAP